jgi:hypothetical protein
MRSRNPDLFQSSDGDILRNTPKALGILFGSLAKSFFAHQRFFPLGSLRSPRAAGAQAIRNCLAEAMTNAHAKLQFRYSFAANWLR